MLAVLGGGHGGHVLAALAAARRPDLEVRVLTRNARLWNEGLSRSGGIRCVDLQEKTTLHGRPDLVSDNPGAVLAGARIIVLCGRQNDNERLLRRARPHLASGCLIGALNCGCGFQGLAKAALGEELVARVTLFATSILHALIMRGVIRGRGSDPAAWKEEPWFYRVVDDLTAREITTLSNEYLVQGELKGRDLSETAAPQRFGLKSLDEFMAIYTK